MGIAEWNYLVIEGARPDVGVVFEAEPHVLSDDSEWIGQRAPSPARLARSAQIALDGLSVVTEVTGDGRDRPASLS
jgi:hypothetical protein